MSDPVGPRITRAGKLGRVVVGHAARTVGGKAAAPLRDEAVVAAKRDEAILRLADDIVSVLGPMKGGALKVGQIIAMFDFGLSNHDTREEFARRLAPLFDRVKPVGWQSMKSALTRELGRTANRLDIDPEPIAAASVGQVYRAVLDGRHPVAVKVQYPGIDVAVRADLKNLKLLSRISGASLPGANLHAIVDEVAREVALEIDYVAEARNQARAAQLCAGHPVWTVPAVRADLSTPRVLVSDYLDGQPFESLVDGDRERAEMAGEAIYRFYSGGVYAQGEFCADPHPGNVLALDDGRIAFLDFGLYVVMSEQARADQTAVLRALMEERYHDAYEAGVRMGVSSVGAIGEDEVIDLMRDIAFWFLTEDPVTITPKTARRAVTSLFVPGASHLTTTRNTELPTEHIFSRRTDLAVCGLLGQLNATNRWGAIAREWSHGNAPATPMGESISRWRQ